MGQYPEYKSKLNYVWQNVALTLKVFAAKLLPFIFSPWVDISDTSTIVGWSSYTSKRIRYCVIGKMVVVTYSISGTSDSILTSFTLPIPSSINSAAATDVCFGADNNIQSYITAILSAGTSTVNFLYQTSLPWTNSGTKIVTGHTIYEID